MPYMLSCLTYLVPTCSRGSRALCPTRSRAAHASCPTCSRALRTSCLTFYCVSLASCPTCSSALRTSYLTCCTVNHYDMKPVLMEYYCSGFFISDISLQDPLINVNLTTLIHQPAFIREPAFRRAC